jgi:hypothetical protein
MPIFKLKKENNSIENAVLVPAAKTALELEKHLESWLENSPWAIAQEPLLIIGRQTTATTEEYGTIFPDLLGIDKEGNLVIIELKKGRTPREVITQLLEYAAWANDLSDEKIHDIATNYIKSINTEKDIETLFFETFETDEIPSLNQRLRLFVAAEEISPSVAKVCRFLRQVHGVDVNCIQFNIFQTESGEVLVNSEAFVGLEDVVAPKKTVTSQRWAGEKPVILKKYPNFNKNTVGCQIISDSVNHTSRRHYPGGEDRYWWKEKGKYKLFDPSTDKQD